jgi:aspartate 1-decarboxylase
MRWILRSKIHRVTVTDANPEYVGSIKIDAELMEHVGLSPEEKVLVAS